MTLEVNVVLITSITLNYVMILERIIRSGPDIFNFDHY
jgi:hypothetical protein